MNLPMDLDYETMNKQMKSLDFDLPINYTFSDTQFEIIKKYIQDFENTLDNKHEVGILLTNFGQTVLMTVTEISYEKSVIMVFKGYVNNRKSTLLQHVNQLNFLLTTVEKDQETPKRKIGFTIPNNT